MQKFRNKEKRNQNLKIYRTTIFCIIKQDARRETFESEFIRDANCGSISPQRGASIQKSSRRRTPGASPRGAADASAKWVALPHELLP